MDAFYASIELRDHPEYVGKPLSLRPVMKLGNTESVQPCRLSKPGNFARM